MKQAVGYVRVSGCGQVDGHGWDRQEEDIHAFCGGKRYRLIEIYREAHTGTEADRPELARLLGDLLSNSCRTVIVASMDRFARDLGIQMQLLSVLRSHGVQLVSAATGEDVTESLDRDPMTRAMVQFQGMVAELDKSLTVRKLRRAREARRAAEGRCEGRKPYGYHENERVVLNEIFRLRTAHHLSYREIAARLNSEGVTTRYGRPWNPGTVKRIVDRGRPHVDRARQV